MNLFLSLKPPGEARQLLLSSIKAPLNRTELVETISALERVCAEDIQAPHPLPQFARSTVDGYAVRASDTFGASDAQPAYLRQTGEVPMGASPNLHLSSGDCALIHTGGMIPAGATAVVMLEHAQSIPGGEIEIFRAAAEGENTIRIGEDVEEGEVVIHRGQTIGPAEIGGLVALGVMGLRVVEKARIGLISSGDEVIDPAKKPSAGQVRDVNTFTLAGLVNRAGGIPIRYGIIPDEAETLKRVAQQAVQECDCVVITAGSSASSRDLTADVIDALGTPGVLVHGVNTRPGKPTILGCCDGKAVIGLPGNPVSALVNGYLFLVPVLEKLLGREASIPAVVQAQLTINLPSQAGREDWWPVKLIRYTGGYQAEPIFGKSNLIFTLANADGLLRIPPDATGLTAGALVEVFPL